MKNQLCIREISYIKYIKTENGYFELQYYFTILLFLFYYYNFFNHINSLMRIRDFFKNHKKSYWSQKKIGSNLKEYKFSSAVKWLITFKIKDFVYMIYVCVLRIFIMYI